MTTPSNAEWTVVDPRTATYSVQDGDSTFEVVARFGVLKNEHLPEHLQGTAVLPDIPHWNVSLVIDDHTIFVLGLQNPSGRSMWAFTRMYAPHPTLERMMRTYGDNYFPGDKPIVTQRLAPGALQDRQAEGN